MANDTHESRPKSVTENSILKVNKIITQDTTKRIYI